MGNFNKGGRGSDNAKFEKKMFRATCADCGNSCEIPFAPKAGRPVYCRECFTKKGGRDGRPERSDFRPRTFSPNSFEGAGLSGETKRQIESIANKLDRLIEKVDALTRIKLSQEKTAENVSAPAPKKDVKEEIEKNKKDLKKLVETAVKPEKKKIAKKTKKS